jgi:hypothetical protein
MTIELWLSIFLIISLFINGFFFWFIREQSKKLLIVSGNINDLFEMISTYRNHLKDLYSMEMFYGDESLNFLLQHTKSLLKILEDQYGEITYLTEPLEIEQEDEQTYEQIYEQENEQENEQEKDVFYAGTRRSDH